MKLVLPKEGNNVDIEISQSIVILGSNGSGKTRLGTWIEINGPENKNVHRISAQKSLMFPDVVSGITTIESAEKDLRYGNSSDGSGPGYRLGHRRGGKPDTHLLNDYNKLLNLLFSEYIKDLSDFNEGRISIKPNTKLHKIKEIREKILPQRELILSGNTIHAKSRIVGSNQYNASGMSDGERVIFYLIGQCVSAPSDAMIIVDEPELHLHKAIQTSLRNEIEKQRKDCPFVYLTHDVDFAASKTDAKKIWLKSFDGTKWDWEEYEDILGVPEELQLEIIGTKQKVLFVEGDINSLDNELYRVIFPNFLIKPCGGCKNVIDYTKAFRENPQFVSMEFYGLIDKDRRIQSEIDTLKSHGIYVLEVAEIENIFMIPELLNVVSEKLDLNVGEKLIEVTDAVIAFLQTEQETQIAMRLSEEIRYKLHVGKVDTRSIENLKGSIDNLFASIDFPALKIQETELIESIITDKNYSKLLEVYNRKNLVDRIAPLFNLQKKGLQQLIIRSLGNNDYKQKIIDGVKKYIPAELVEKTI